VRDPSSKEPVLGVRRHGGQPDKKEALAKQLNIEETIENNGGRGSSTQKTNFNDLPESKQGEIDDQINIMIKQNTQA
jgi:hypothetical protein